MSDLDEILGPDGLLSRHIPGFAFRPQQLGMAQAVERAIEQDRVLVSEAGTGTGKTFAYLVPALLSGKKIIVSTGTRNLQDQLFHRDLPLVRDTLGSPARIALLKGRANYLCPQRMDSAGASGRLPTQQVGQLMRVRDWAWRTRSGDIAELGLPEDAGIWPHVTSTSDNCLGQDCPELPRCHLAEARRKAQEADLVVVNHHLLCADLALKDGGFGEILPGADCFILDEAHQLPDVAGNFFGLSLSHRQLMDLARDVETAYLKDARDAPGVADGVETLKKAVRDFRLGFGPEPRRGPWRDIENDNGIQQSMSALGDALAQLAAVLGNLEGRSKDLDHCRGRSAELKLLLDTLAGVESENAIRWYETHKQGFRLNQTPLEVAEVFQAQMGAHRGSWIFTSATLAVGESFQHFQQQLGIPEADTGRWDSPFDYARQALLLLPEGLPEPSAPDFDRRVMELALPVLEASGGRAFLLFTSHRALQLAAQWLERRSAFPLMVQGSAPRAELLERFRRSGNGVLLGTSSFWEGVDVRGQALSCVIIDKLPFVSPGDPVMQARIDSLRRHGGNPFRDFQLPQAVITLKQGAGRLIRDERDHGVLVVCDPRLLTRAYGRAFLASLPPMRRSRRLADVQDFFAGMQPGDDRIFQGSQDTATT
jgi:ATP-dependent DNA helicase DinG